MNEEEIKKEFNGKLKALRKIIHSYGIFLDAPSNSFDSLNLKILRHLYNNADYEKIKRVIESELITNYGLFADEIEADTIASEIINWWNQ